MRGHRTGPACRRGRGRRRQWPSCPTNHRPRHPTTTTSAPTTGCWRRCTSSTRPTQLGRRDLGCLLQDPRRTRRRQWSAGARPLRSPAGPHRRRPRKQRNPNPPPGRVHQSPRPSKAATGPGPAQAAPDAGSSPRPLPPPTVQQPAPKRNPTVERPAQNNEGRPTTPRSPRRRTRGSAQSRGPAQCQPRAAGQDGAPRRASPNRQEHGHLAVGADRDQRPLAAGEAADRPARGDQQPSAPGPRRQGLLHPPHRLRDGAGAQDPPGDEHRLRRDRRQAHHGGAGPRQPRPGHRHAEAGRHPAAAGPQHQELRDAGLRPVLVRVRADGQEGPRRSAHRRGLRRHHHHA